MRHALFPMIVATALLVSVCPAEAVYAPQLEVRLEPSTPATPAALTAILRQRSGESATRSERVRFPAQFLFNPGSKVSPCTAEQERGSCPEESRIGTASAQTAFGPFSGPVYLTKDFRFLILLRGAGLVEQKVVGFFQLHPDGSVESIIEDLPNVPATEASLSFEGGPRSLLLTPRACGAYSLQAQFESHAGERANVVAPVQVTGCDTLPRIRLVTTRARRSGRAASVQVTWELTDGGAATIVRIDQARRVGRFIRWRRVRQIRAAARSGRNRVRVAGLTAAGRARYRVVLTTFSARGGPVDRALQEFAVAKSET